MNLGFGRGYFSLVKIWLFMPGLVCLMLSCENQALPPVVETTGVIDIGFKSFTARGTLVQTGEKGVSQHGFCLSISPGPDLKEDSCTALGPRTETGTFSSVIQGLDRNTIYYIRAYAVNQAGTAYGNEVVVKTEGTLTWKGRDRIWNTLWNIHTGVEG